MVRDQKAFTGGTGSRCTSVCACSVELLTTVIDIGHGGCSFVGMISPEPAFGCGCTLDDAQGRILDLERRVVDRADLEEVEDVIEGMKRQCPSVGLWAGSGSGFVETLGGVVSVRGIRGHRGTDAYRQRNFFCTSVGQNVRADVVGPGYDLPPSVELVGSRGRDRARGGVGNVVQFVARHPRGRSSSRTAVFLPRMAQSSEDQFGVLGLMFTFVGWLFAYSAIVVTATCISASFSRGSGSLGAWLRSSPTCEGQWFHQKD